ncbi:MAG: type II toxin-antitoxin system Phd/YefM family antitoxin [Actinomycetes bacterium]
MEVGIRELKARLSEYIGRVAAGETFTVTDRGEPRALLVPLPGADELARGMAEGWVTRRSTKPPGPAKPVEPVPGTPRSEEIISDDRGD